MFHPGETSTQLFELPFKKSDIKKVIVSYRQKGQIVLERTVTSPGNIVASADDTTLLSVTLTEAESLLFKDFTDVAIQLNVIFNGNSSNRAVSSEVYTSTGIQHIRDTLLS